MNCGTARISGLFNRISILDFGLRIWDLDLRCRLIQNLKSEVQNRFNPKPVTV
jgi:hypothetical protein